LPILLRQQQPGIFERTRHTLQHRHCVSRSWACLNIYSKLLWNTTFFQNTSVVLLDFQP
jgi:hypothetical protein